MVWIFHGLTRLGRTQSLSEKKSLIIHESLKDKRVSSQTIHKTLLDSIIFGGQFRKITKYEDKVPEIDLSSTINKYQSKDALKINQVRKMKKIP
jgi:hypothetical protein